MHLRMHRFLAGSSAETAQSMPLTRSREGSSAHQALQCGELMREASAMRHLNQAAVTSLVQRIADNGCTDAASALRGAVSSSSYREDRRTWERRLLWVVAAAIPLPWSDAQAQALEQLVGGACQVQHCHACVSGIHLRARVKARLSLAHAPTARRVYCSAYAVMSWLLLARCLQR